MSKLLTKTTMKFIDRELEVQYQSATQRQSSWSVIIIMTTTCWLVLVAMVVVNNRQVSFP